VPSACSNENVPGARPVTRGWDRSSPRSGSACADRREKRNRLRKAGLGVRVPSSAPQFFFPRALPPTLRFLALARGLRLAPACDHLGAFRLIGLVTQSGRVPPRPLRPVPLAAGLSGDHNRYQACCLRGRHADS
jgi:hypothetical protein